MLWGERGGEREVSLFLYCKNEHVNYSCDECISLSLLFFCCMFQLPMACTTTEHSVIVVGKIFTTQRNVFLISFIAFWAAVGHFPLGLFEFNRIFSKKRKPKFHSSLKTNAGKICHQNVIKEKKTELDDDVCAAFIVDGRVRRVHTLNFV